MHVDVIIDVSADGKFLAWIDTVPETRSTGESKGGAATAAIALFLEELSKKMYRKELAPELVFPLFVTPVDLGMQHCMCSPRTFYEPHLRDQHGRSVGLDGGIVYGFCTRAGCFCRGFSPLWGS